MLCGWAACAVGLICITTHVGGGHRLITKAPAIWWARLARLLIRLGRFVLLHLGGRQGLAVDPHLLICLRAHADGHTLNTYIAHTHAHKHSCVHAYMQTS